MRRDELSTSSDAASGVDIGPRVRRIRWFVKMNRVDRRREDKALDERGVIDRM